MALSAALFSWVPKPPTQSEVTFDRDAEEYRVYSAFINQKYIHLDQRGGFSLKGTVIEGFGPDKITEVVILPRTMPTLDAYIPQTKLRAMLPPVEQSAFSDYLATNDQAYPLVAKFNLKVTFSFFSKADGNADSPVVNETKTPRGRFVASHPNALGYLELSRVGFATDQSVAVVGFAQSDFDARSGSERMLGGLVSLRKQDGKWTVQNVYLNSTPPKPLTIELEQCAPATDGLGWGLGSANISVKGRRGAACLIEHMSEMEGGYTRSECSIPVSIGTLTIYQGNTDFYYSVNISKNCKVIGSGNLLFGNMLLK